MKTEYFILLHRKNSCLYHRSRGFALEGHAYAGNQQLEEKEQRLTTSQHQKSKIWSTNKFRAKYGKRSINILYSLRWTGST